MAENTAERATADAAQHQPSGPAVASPFDYAALSIEKAKALRVAASHVQHLGRTVIAHCIEIATELNIAKGKLPPGQFGLWLNAEFGLNLFVDPSALGMPLSDRGDSSTPRAHEPLVSLEDWYRRRVEGWPPGVVKPSRDDDVAAAEKAGYKKRGTWTKIQALRKRYAPHWAKSGPKRARKQ